MILVTAGLENLIHFGRPFPIPFLLLYGSTVLAAVVAGRWTGFLAGVLASGVIFHAYLVGFGPPALTGQAWTVALAALLFLGSGFGLGRMRDQRDSHLAALQVHRRELQERLKAETREKEQSQSDSALNEARLRSAVRIAGIGHFEFDRTTGDCIFCSSQHAAHFGIGIDEFKRQTASTEPKLGFVHPEDRPRMRASIAALKTGAPQSFEYRAIRADGEVRHIREVVEPIRDREGNLGREIGTSVDMTELRQAEVQLRESQKLEAVGHLTAGVAHDFNNLLAVILGNLELLEFAQSEEESRELVAAAIGATTRGAALTAQLLSFGRKALLTPEPVNVCASIRELGALFRRTLPANIEISMAGPPAGCTSELDRVQLESALLNLVVNAADAMPDGGTLTIENRMVELKAKDARRLGLDLAPGTYVITAISDTGTGMPEAVRSRAFDPFFTTKEVGKGSGLGLSMVLGFVRQSGGDVQIETQQGEGTRVTLYFPATRTAPAMTGPPEQAVECGAGQERILLVEDDPAVLNITTTQLESLNYRVIAASTGAEALERLAEVPDISLMISDIMMPGDLQGTELADRARAAYPGLRVLLMSGYHEAERTAGAPETGDFRVLTKPVRRSELKAEVAAELARRRNGSGTPCARAR